MFDPADGMLRGREGERKVEHRAARTLALLCARRGEIVSQPMILDEVWNGRSVSPNSVAVVIADLRRALGDDARDPLYIETVARRGYRLKQEPRPAAVDGTVDPQPVIPRRAAYPRLVILAAALGLFITVAAFYGWLEYGRTDVRIAVEPVRNDTGVVGYGPLASAMSELLVNRIATFEAVEIQRQTGSEKIVAPAHGLVMQSRLILWNGMPTLSMTSQDRGGHVVWTGMVMGPPGVLAQKTIAELSGLRAITRARSEHPCGVFSHALNRKCQG